MPLIALNQTTNERVDITKYDKPLVELRADDLVCPLCESKMIVVSAVLDYAHQIRRIAHFRHHRLNDCIYTAYGAGESEAHRAAKVWLRKQLRNESGFDVPVELEYYIPEIRRIADVAQLFPNGWIVVHEIQLAAISVESLEERTRDYMAAGCDVLWYLGNNAATDTNFAWAENFQGFGLQIFFLEDAGEFYRFDEGDDAEAGGGDHDNAVHSNGRREPLAI